MDDAVGEKRVGETAGVVSFVFGVGRRERRDVNVFLFLVVLGGR